MLAPSCRTRRAMRPAEIIGFGWFSTRFFSLVRQGCDGGAGRRQAPIQAMVAAEAAVEVDRLAAEVRLRLPASVRAVAEDHAAAAGELEPAVQPLLLGGEDVA